MTDLIWIIIAPVILALVLLLFNRRWLDRFLLPAGALLHLYFTFKLYGRIGGPASSWFAVDHLSWIFLFILSVLFLATALYSVDYLPRAHSGERRKQWYPIFLLTSLSAMTGAVLANHLGLMWVFIEATTLLTAPLIMFQKNRHSLEASWKYLFICSVGIALAFIGLLLLALAGSKEGHATGFFLSELLAGKKTFDPLWLKIAFAFIVGGYGAKAGLAPIHTWLPDAHSQAPSAVSAILSGTLLNCALLGIFRFYQVLQDTAAYSFARGVLLVTGLLSIFVCAVYILRIKDYKRMLAYSSMENIGIIVVGVALGGYAALGALIHLLAHSFTKSALFLTSGNILHRFGSKEIEKVTGLLRSDKLVGVLWISGILSLTAVPPFATFISELMILAEMILEGQILLFILFSLMLTVVLAGLLRASFRMVLGESQKQAESIVVTTWSRLLTQASAFGLLLIVFLLSSAPWTPAGTLLEEAAALLGGGK